MHSSKKSGDTVDTPRMLSKALSMQMQIEKAWSLIETIETDLATVSGDSLRFRIDLFKNAKNERNAFRFRVLRYDLFRLSPLSATQVEDEGPADHEVLIVDPLFDGFEVNAATAKAAWQQLFSKIERQFFVE